MGILTNLLESDASILVESVVTEEIRKVGAYDYEPIFREIAEVLYEDYSQQIQNPQVLRATLQEALDIAALTIALFEAEQTTGTFTVNKVSGKCPSVEDIKKQHQLPDQAQVQVKGGTGNDCTVTVTCPTGYVWDGTSNKCVQKSTGTGPTTGTASTSGPTAGTTPNAANAQHPAGLLDKAKHWAHEHPYQAAAAGAGAALGAGLVGYGAYKLGKKVWEKLKNR